MSDQQQDSIQTVDTQLENVMARLRSDKGNHDDKIAAMQQAEALRNRAKYTAEIASQLGPRYSPDKSTLERFEVFTADQGKAREIVAKFIADVEARTRAGEGIVLVGSVGTGKDHLLAAALYAAVGIGFSCKFIACQDFYGRIRDRMGTGQAEDELIRDLTAPAILALSDPVPPVGELSAWRLEFLYRVLDRRYRALRPTWVTINANSIAEIDGKLSAQCWDRLQEAAVVVPCFWQSYRERRKR